MKEKKFFFGFFFPTIAASICLVIYLYTNFHGRRTEALQKSIGASWDDKYNDFLVQKIKTLNGKWILVDADSFDTKIGYFDEIISVNTEDFTINNIFGKRNDSFFLIDVFHKKIITSFKAESVKWEKKISLYAANGYSIEARPDTYWLATFYRDSLIGIIESNYGKVISSNVFSNVTFEKDLIRVVKNNKVGYIKRDGTFLINTIYTQLGYLGEYAAAPFTTENETGIINSHGQVLRSFDLNHTVEYHTEHFIVKKNDTAYLLDISGHNLFDEPNSNIEIINQTYLYIYRNYRIGVYNIESRGFILDCVYDNIYFNDVFYLTKQGLKGLYKPDGSLSISCRYEDITSANNSQYYIKKDGLWGLANSSGTEIIPPLFNDILPHEQGSNLFFVRRYNKLGLYNCDKSSLVIPCQYTDIDEFDYDGYYEVKINDWVGIFNSNTGSVVVPLEYSEIARQKYNNYARVTNFSGYTGWLDYHTGKVIIPIIYEHISGDFDSQLSRVDVRHFGTAMRIRPDGTMAGSNLKEDVKNGLEQALNFIGDKIN